MPLSTPPSRVRVLLALTVALPGCFSSPDAKESGLAAASITDPRDGASVESGAEVRFLGVAGDGTSVEGLTATWTAAPSATPDATVEVCPPVAPAADGATACTFVPSEVGDLVCLRVDSPTEQATDCVTVTVVEATGAPTVAIESPDPDATWYADEDVLLVVTASDAADSYAELTVGWTSSLDGDLGEATDLDASGRSTRELRLSEGEHLLTATVTDSQGLTATDEVVVDVRENSPPTCEILSPEDGATGAPRTDVTFVGQVTDVDIAEDLIDVGWESDLDGRLFLGGADATGRSEFTTDALSDGTHRISLIAADERGERCSDMVLFAVASPPQVEILEPQDDATFARGQSITFVGTVTDEDDAPETLAVEWISNVDGLLDTTPPDRTGTTTFTTDALSEGNHTITFVAIDPEGSISRLRVRITVGGCGGLLWYADADGDGYGDPDNVSGECERPEGFVDNALDCDDLNAEALPGGIEVCNGVDDDCDSFTDEAEAIDPVTWHADDDRDGYGDAADVIVQCDAPAGYVRDATDCDDGAVGVNPGADETPGDGVDADCDGSETCWTDRDGDGSAGTAGPGGGDLDCADAGEFSTGDDCDDGDTGVFPGATETCDGLDQDCDGTIDDGATDLLSWYADLDGDTYGDPASVIVTCEGPAGFVDNALDCDDADGAIHPGVADDCDGVDDDCDGSYDEESVTSPFHPDADGDGYGATDTTVMACVAPAGHVADASDCDDDDASVSPVGTESPADAKDGNCDGREDCYVDADRDGFGSTTVATGDDTDCLDAREADNATDCDDGDVARNPGEIEICNGVDDNCDALTDDASAADASTWYADLDGDLFGDDENALAACVEPEGYVVDAGDCNDADPAVFPGTTDICNGDDDDCDGEFDEDSSRVTWYGDRDGDGHGNSINTVLACVAPTGFVGSSDDCDDARSTVYPGAPEVPADGVDQSCDGIEDCWIDGDADGYGSEATVASADLACTEAGEAAVSGDCADADPARNPAVVEVCNGIDDDCDGTDDDDASDATVYYTDADADTWGDPSTAVRSCSPLADQVTDGSDCDDTRATSFPGAYDACDGLDNNCDGEVDEATAEGRPTWYADADGDTFGNASSTAPGCTAPAGFVANATDCDDTRATVYPAAPETIADGIDQSCDGRELCYLDLDRDGYGTSSTRASTDLDCTGNLESPANTDCDDEVADVHPGADELCNDIDDNCDEEIDEPSAVDALEWFLDLDADGYGDGTTGQWSCDPIDGRTSDDTDCNDDDAAVRPGVAEIPADEVDQDCDGTEICPRDLDVDGFADDAGTLTTSADADCRDAGEALVVTDCDDTNQTIYPGAPEVVADRIDQDCSGADVCYADDDADGYGTTELRESPDGLCVDRGESAVGGDCDDAAVAVNPAATEVCDGIDNNCEGTADGAEAVGAAVWYADDDSDTFGTVDLYTTACAAPAGFVADATDCDDSDRAVNPAQTERCATVVDDNCDGSTENVGADDCVEWFVDTDGDGWGIGEPSCRCNEGDGYTTLFDGDCAPDVSAISPGALEICDPDDVDEDCDGVADDGDSSVSDQGVWVIDADGDGFGDDATATPSCDAIEGRITTGGDCDEADAGINPGAVDVCLDGIDQDCDGGDCGWDGDYAIDDPEEYATRIVGSAGSMRYGSDLDAQGDFDGDGRVDLAVVAGFDTTGGGSYGSVFLHHLPLVEGELGSSSRDAVLYGDTTSAKIDAAFGIPDINGDGRDELFIRRGDFSGALVLGGFADGAQAWNAAAYVSTTCADADGAGQWNGLGNDEWICGNPTTTSNTGAAYVYNGVSVYGTLNGETRDDEAGISVAGGPGNDVDGDGYGDVWVGALGDDDAGDNAGAVYLVQAPVFGTMSLATADNKILGLLPGDELGFQVHRAGDVDLDGYADLFAGAPDADGGGSASGEAYLFTNSRTATSPGEALATFIGADMSDNVGSFGMTTGDVDGDGTTDALLCSPWNDAFGASTGTAWLVFGPLSGTYDLDALSGHHARFYGSNVLDYVGADCSLVADLDDDGRDEIAVSGWGYDSGSSFFNGAVWLMPGE